MTIILVNRNSRTRKYDIHVVTGKTKLKGWKASYKSLDLALAEAGQMENELQTSYPSIGEIKIVVKPELKDMT